MNNVKIAGTGSYAPKNIVSNMDLAKLVDTNDEWIRSRTGISERRISEGEDTSDLSVKAALIAIEDAKMCPSDIDMIIVATITPDSFIPSTACHVQKKINAVNATCFDISAACSGFIYGLNIASVFIKSGEKKNVLVIGAETLSKIIDWSDRGTCVLFGDGAGAAVLTSSSEECIKTFYTMSDGSLGKHLTCGAFPVVNPYAELKEEYMHGHVHMNGAEIFRFAVKVMIEGIERLLKEADLTLEDIKYIIPHQANYRIIDYVCKKLNINSEKFYTNLDRFGNTSAASIAMALDEANKRRLLCKGDKIILVGFGGGLTSGGVVIEWGV